MPDITFLRIFRDVDNLSQENYPSVDNLFEALWYADDFQIGEKGYGPETGKTYFVEEFQAKGPNDYPQGGVFKLKLKRIIEKRGEVTQTDIFRLVIVNRVNEVLLAIEGNNIPLKPHKLADFIHVLAARSGTGIKIGSRYSWERLAQSNSPEEISKLKRIKSLSVFASNQILEDTALRSLSKFVTKEIKLDFTPQKGQNLKEGLQDVFNQYHTQGAASGISKIIASGVTERGHLVKFDSQFAASFKKKLMSYDADSGNNDGKDWEEFWTNEKNLRGHEWEDVPLHYGEKDAVFKKLIYLLN